jgi:hypothetical protein
MVSDSGMKWRVVSAFVSLAGEEKKRRERRTVSAIK